MTIQVGQIITDGTATFIIDDARDGHRVGNIILDHILRQGYVKANGAILQAADYPRLVQFVIENNLSVSETDWQESMSGMYVYDDTAKTLRVPDLRGVVLRGIDNGKGYDMNRVLGTYQEDMIKKHNHTTGVKGPWDGHTDNTYPKYHYADGITGETGGEETRMKNIALIAQIKY